MGSDLNRLIGSESLASNLPLENLYVVTFSGDVFVLKRKNRFKMVCRMQMSATNRGSGEACKLEWHDDVRHCRQVCLDATSRDDSPNSP